MTALVPVTEDRLRMLSLQQANISDVFNQTWPVQQLQFCTWVNWNFDLNTHELDIKLQL